MSDALREWLERAARRPDRGITFVDRRERETTVPWPDLVARASEVAGGLLALGVEPGDRVALAFPTGEGFLAAFLGALAAGAAPAPLPPPSRLGNVDEQQRRLAAMLAAAAPRLVLADAPLLPLLREPVASVRPALRLLALDELPRAVADPVDVDEETLGLVQFSSGTTGSPKPVALSRRALAVQARLLNALWPEAAAGDGAPHEQSEPSAVHERSEPPAVFGHRGFSWLPLHHDMGLVGCVLPALERPADLWLLPPEAFVAKPALWLRGIARARATVSAAPTFAFARALRRVRDEELDGVDLSSWRHALCGAEAVSPQTLDEFARRFARWGFRREALTPVYGLAEAGLAVTFGALDTPFTVGRFDRRALLAGRAVADPHGREIAGVGRPLPGFAVAARDDDGRDLPAGRVGGIWVRGPSLMEGYLGDAEATAEALRDGWLDTGDLGFVDAQGELYLVGRRKDLVIVRGRNHAPEEIEEAVASVAGVRQGGVAALGWLPERAAEEELLLLVERARGDVVDGVAVLAAACRDAVRARVGVEAGSVAVLPPGTLPRTSSGKLRRTEALRRWLAGELATAGVDPAGVAAAAADETSRAKGEGMDSAANGESIGHAANHEVFGGAANGDDAGAAGNGESIGSAANGVGRGAAASAEGLGSASSRARSPERG
ncbi:MAG TPA: AMP-binding protein [Thermoanaerobaculia bacterium]|nr:AMP-binding protein [Thermoanaerobaculia bacterium]